MSEISFVYLAMICANTMFIVWLFNHTREIKALNEKNEKQQKQIDDLKRKLEELKREK